MESTRIIIADDLTIFRKGLRSLIESESSTIEVIGEAADGEKLLEQLTTKQPDVILLDIEMPIMNGIEALIKIKILYPTIKVILLSSHTDQLLIRDLQEKGAHGYITKNEVFEKLVQVIKAVKTGGEFFK